MRWVGLSATGACGNERGAIAPLTAMMMVALLGMAALAIDTGMLYSEHAQLQNGADATALAVAESCSGGLHLDACQKDLANANLLASANAIDGQTEVVSSKVLIGATGGTVDVVVQSKDSTGKKLFSLEFARVLGIESVDMRAFAQARFDGYSRAHVLPLAFSECETDPDFTKGLQFFPVHGNATKSLCKSKSSGAEIPGGFGWLVRDAPTTCNLTIVVSNAYKGDGGNDVPAACKTQFAEFKATLEGGKPVEVLVPIFDSVSGSGSEAVFSISAFAQISLRGWAFHSNSYLKPEAKSLSDSMRLTASDNGLFGTYVRKVSLAEAAVLGGPATYKALGIRLSN